MFDVSARPGIKGEMLSFALPMRKFEAIVRDMGESFLTTSSWEVVRRRVAHRVREGS